MQNMAVVLNRYASHCVLNLVMGNMNLRLKYDLIALLCLPVPNETWLYFVYKDSSNFPAMETSDKQRLYYFTTGGNKQD